MRFKTEALDWVLPERGRRSSFPRPCSERCDLHLCGHLASAQWAGRGLLPATCRAPELLLTMFWDGQHLALSAGVSITRTESGTGVFLWHRAGNHEEAGLSYTTCFCSGAAVVLAAVWGLVRSLELAVQQNAKARWKVTSLPPWTRSSPTAVWQVPQIHRLKTTYVLYHTVPTGQHCGGGLLSWAHSFRVSLGWNLGISWPVNLIRDFAGEVRPSQPVGRIHFLEAVGLMSAFSCQLLRATFRS